MNLTLIRHTAVDVPKGVCYGQTDVPLAPTFEAEARQVRDLIDGSEFDMVFTSPLSRCVRLASACGYPDARRDARLMEMDFGEWEMKRWDEITDPRLQEWYDDYFNVAATGGESFVSQGRRVASFIATLRESGYRRVAIFTHGGTIIQFLLNLGLITPETTFDHQPPYGGIVEVSLSQSQ